MYPTISIIVPIYNAEKYLEKCIESILEQRYKNFELLLINDGSIDETEHICEKFLHDSRVCYQKQKNKGVSAARNLGLSISKGKYICFVDADDYVSENYLNNFIDNMSEDTIVIQDFNLQINQKIIYNHQNYINRVLTFPEQLNEFTSDYRITQGYLVNKIFEKKVIIRNQLSFNEDIKIGEDEDFFLRYITYIRVIKLLDCANYYYVQHDDSASKKTPIFESEFVRLKESIYFLDFLLSQTINEKVLNKYVDMRFNMLFNYCLRTSLYKNNYQHSERIKALRKLSLLDKNYLRRLKPKTILQKLDYFLFRHKFYYILDFILYNKSKYN